MSESAPSGPRGDAGALSPFADYRDLYVLIAGIVIGLLLSHAVLGQVAPQTYERWFVGSGEAGQELERLHEQLEQDLEQLEQTGVTAPAAIAEHRRGYEAELERLEAEVVENQRAHQGWLSGRLSALLLVVVGVMVAEALAGPRVEGGRAVVRPALRRLVTARYALLALWLGLVIAQPALLGDMAWGFVLLVAAVAVLAAFVPLRGKGRGEAEAG